MDELTNLFLIEVKQRYNDMKSEILITLSVASVQAFAPAGITSHKHTMYQHTLSNTKDMYNRGPLFATTISPEDPLNDEVQRLREMAATLREEAASLEAEQKMVLSKAMENVFSRFDTNQDGKINVTELKQGLEKALKIDLPLERANQLLDAFDTNEDGALQVDEFVGVDRFRSQLDALLRKDRESAREQERLSREAAEMEQKQLVVNDGPATGTDRVISVLPYLFPLLDGLQFARYFVMGNQDNPLAIAATIAYTLYRAIPFGGLISFFALNFLSENPKINRLVRFNMQQAIFMDIALFLPAIITSLGVGLLEQTGIMVIPENAVELGNDAAFVALLLAVSYTTVSSLLGETPNKLPGISQRVEDRMLTPDMFDADGRFQPFDDAGNLKTPSKSKNQEDDSEDSI